MVDCTIIPNNSFPLPVSDLDTLMHCHETCSALGEKCYFSSPLMASMVMWLTLVNRMCLPSSHKNWWRHYVFPPIFSLSLSDMNKTDPTYLSWLIHLPPLSAHMRWNEFSDLASMVDCSLEFTRVISVYLDKPRCFTCFTRKVSLPSLYKGEKRFHVKWFGQNDRISIRKLFSTLFCVPSKHRPLW